MNSNAVILLVEDDIDLNNANRRALELKNYTTLTAHNLAEAREHLNHNEPDVILLDVMLPDGSGFDFCEEIRGKTDAYIIFLTAKSEQESILHGLGVGGDDYMRKPFHVGEMLARVESSIRRRKIILQSPTPDGTALVLEMSKLSASLDGVDLGLTQKEFEVLALLAKNKNKTLSAETIYNQAWRQPLIDDTRALQVVISKLRKKIQNADFDIVAKRGEGYVLTIE